MYLRKLQIFLMVYFLVSHAVLVAMAAGEGGNQMVGARQRDVVKAAVDVTVSIRVCLASNSNQSFYSHDMLSILYFDAFPCYIFQ